MTDLMDLDLIAASAKGDARAFGRLVERHHAAVTAVAFAITRDLSTSEDIAQDTFVIAWTQLGELRDPARLRAWLCGIARNLSRGELRDRKREITDIDKVKLASSDTLDALGLIEAAESEHQVRNALDDLPPSYREPLVLFYWEGQSIARVASALEMSESAAQKRISRARAMLTSELEARFDTTARARRPAKAAAAAIVAMLAGRGVRVSEAAGRNARPLSKLAGLGAAAFAILGVFAWMLVTPRSAASTTQRERPEPVERAPLASAPAAPTVEPIETSADSEYMFERLPSGIKVDLTDRPYTPNPYEPAAVLPASPRHIRGHVVDASGKPVAAAVVAAGRAQFQLSDAFLFADAAAKTDADGAFDIVISGVNTRPPLKIIALSRSAGWSVPANVTDDSNIDIQIPHTGGLQGVVRRDGAPAEAEIWISARDVIFNYVVKTDAHGRFALPRLSPATYSLRAISSEHAASGAGMEAKRDVTVSDTPTSLTIDLPTGTLVAVNVTRTDSLRLAFVKLRNASTEILGPAVVIAGKPTQAPAQFHDIAPGSYDVCVQRFHADDPATEVCQPLTIRAADSVIEVELDAKNGS